MARLSRRFGQDRQIAGSAAAANRSAACALSQARQLAVDLWRIKSVPQARDHLINAISVEQELRAESLSRLIWAS
jgi:hypothetical protein